MNKLEDAGVHSVSTASRPSIVRGVGGVRGMCVTGDDSVASTAVTGMGDVTGSLVGRGEKGEPVAAKADVVNESGQEDGGGGESTGREIQGEREGTQGEREGTDALDGKGKEVTARRVSMEMTV